MGRSSRADADENRRRIVELADGEFRARGVKSARIADIMKLAGLTPGGFYKHFESKEALASEACATAFGRAGDNWQSLNAPNTDPQSSLGDLISYYLAPKPASKSCPIVSLAADAEQAAGDTPFNESYSNGVEKLFAIFAEAFHKVHPDAPMHRVRSEFASMVGASLLARATGNCDWSTSLLAVFEDTSA